MRTKREVRSVSRAMRLLETLSQAPEPMALGTLSKHLGIPKSTTHYILETLRKGRFVERDRNGLYRVGLDAFLVGTAYSHNQTVMGLFHQAAKEIVGACGETVQLAILDERRVVYIAKEEGTQPVRLVSEVGRSLPAHTTGLGKALLAYLPSDRFDTLFPPGSSFEKMTERSIGSVSVLRQELRRVQEQGYAHDFEETAEGLQCFAAPIFGAGTELIAAMSVAAPSSRVDPGRKAVLISLIKKGAANVSRSMGCAPETVERALRLKSIGKEL